MMRFLLKLFVSMSFVIATGWMLLVPSSMRNDPVTLGVYYYPGWADNPDLSPPWSQPWQRIQDFEDRKPLLGWYPEAETWVAREHIKQMKAANIDFVVFSHLHDLSGAPEKAHAINAFMDAPKWNKPKFAMQWANHHRDWPNSQADFEALIVNVLANYMVKPGYLMIEDKPVFFIFSETELRNRAQQMGMDVSDLLAVGDRLAQEHGFEGIYFVANGVVDEWADRAIKSGYDRVSAYNYRHPPQSVNRSYSHSYAELAAGYEETWNSFADNKIPYILPLTAGWDQRPWGGSSDPLHDNSYPSLQEFEEHLKAGRLFLQSNAGLTNKTAIICCWNEFGEGSYIEPTEHDGDAKINIVKDVFR